MSEVFDKAIELRVKIKLWKRETVLWLDISSSSSFVAEPAALLEFFLRVCNFTYMKYTRQGVHFR